MKCIFQVVLLVFASATPVCGQGYLNWGNNFGATVWRAPIYGPDPLDPFASLSGPSNLSFPTGTTIYGGVLLNGSGWTFAVFAGSIDAAVEELPQVGSTTFRVSTGNSPPAGFVFGQTSLVPGVDVGEPARVQIRVWNNRNGAITSWAQALSAWQGNQIPAGTSSSFVTGPLGGIHPETGMPYPNPIADGFVSFNVYFIPEPETLTIAGLAIAMLTRLRRRRTGRRHSSCIGSYLHWNISYVSASARPWRWDLSKSCSRSSSTPPRVMTVPRLKMRAPHARST